MTNQEFISGVNDLIAHYVQTECNAITERYSYSTPGLITAKTNEVAARVEPIRQKLEEVAKLLEETK